LPIMKIGGINRAIRSDFDIWEI